MKFITVRDLRLTPGKVWKRLRKENELVVTSNGKPVAILCGVDSDNLEDGLVALRRARAQMAVSAMRKSAAERGLDKIKPDEINELIRRTRRSRGR